MNILSHQFKIEIFLLLTKLHVEKKKKKARSPRYIKIIILSKYLNRRKNKLQKKQCRLICFKISTKINNC